MKKKTSISPTHLLEEHSAATIILAGGQGTRLFPLTQTRCKPDVSFAGRYRLIDIPISNSLNSRVSKIFVISQFFATSLNNHITSTFHSDSLSHDNIELLSPEETPIKKAWYLGTADAIRKNMPHFKDLQAEYFIILSGDQLYNMDLKDMLNFAKERKAELTIATIPVQEDDAKRMGLMKINKGHYITDFYEKPTDSEILKQYKTKETGDLERCYLGSMGIYIFKRETLFSLLEKDPREDFGKHIIPTHIKNGGKTAAYIYDGYWEDIGTIASFYKANLALTTNQLGLDLYNEGTPIYAQSVNLPSACVKNTRVMDSILCDGSIIEADTVAHSLIGLRTHIKRGSVIKDSIVIGNSSSSHKEQFYIGKNCVIEKAIVDERTCIEDNVHLTNEGNVKTFDSDNLYVRDGIIIVPAGAHLRKGFRF